MFKPGLYRFVPSLHSTSIPVAVLWVLGVLFVLIGLLSAQGPNDLRSSGSPLTSPRATPTPVFRPAPELPIEFDLVSIMPRAVSHQ